MKDKKTIVKTIKEINRRALLIAIKDIVQVDIWDLLTTLDNNIEEFR